MQPLNLSLLQTATHWHDAAANRDLFDNLLSQVEEQTDVVVLPEMFSTGFTMHSREVAEPMDGPTVEWMRQRAAQRDQVLCGSVVIEEDQCFFNRFVWAQPDGELLWYDKRHCFRMAGEHEHYSAGQSRAVIEWRGWRICPAVCYDLRFPVWLRNDDAYELLLVVANWPAARKTAWSTLLQARAIENLAYVAAVNIVGVDGNGVHYEGGSGAYGPEGQILVENTGESMILDVTLSPEHLLGYREAFPAWMDADDFRLDP